MLVSRSDIQNSYPRKYRRIIAIVLLINFHNHEQYNHMISLNKSIM